MEKADMVAYVVAVDFDGRLDIIVEFGTGGDERLSMLPLYQYKFRYALGYEKSNHCEIVVAKKRHDQGYNMFSTLWERGSRRGQHRKNDLPQLKAAENVARACGNQAYREIKENPTHSLRLVHQAAENFTGLRERIFSAWRIRSILDDERGQDEKHPDRDERLIELSYAGKEWLKAEKAESEARTLVKRCEELAEFAARFKDKE